MVVPPPRPFSLSSDYVNLSFYTFAFWWLVILLIHLSTCVYNAIYAKSYLELDANVLSYVLEANGVGMPREDFSAITLVYTALSALHGFCALWMLLGSLRQRRLSFSMWPHEHTVINPTMYSCDSRFVLKSTKLYQKLIGRHGVFGVNGKYFHIILTSREIIETVIQSVQAIRMSKYLSHTLLNRFYVVLLVLNCWSPAFIYSRWFKNDEARRRFASVLCDCTLDLMSAMGVPLIIVLSYVSEYNVGMASITAALLGDDGWLAQMLNEARMVVIVSWFDLTSRVIFSCGLVASTADLKDLLRYSPRSGNRVVCANGYSIRHLTYNFVPVGPLVKNIVHEAQPGHSTDMKPGTVAPQTEQQSSYKQLDLFTRKERALLRGVHLTFASWGIVVLILHVQASIQTALVECGPKVYPMAGALPSCFVMNFNCSSLGISAKYEEVQAEWERLDRSTVMKVRFLHCSALEIPGSLRDFNRLGEIVVYNSTIVDWGADAAVTNVHHPVLTKISIIRGNMSDGVLPLGLQSRDFPLSVMEINFCETNLQYLPDDLDLKWHPGSIIDIENSQLIVVPPVLMRLQPYYLVIGGNPITVLPPEIFEIEGTLLLTLGRTQVRGLPYNVTQLSPSLQYVDISNTGIAVFLSWIDPLVERMLDSSTRIIAGGSVYCSDLEKILSGASTSFSVPFQSGQSSLLMSASEENWALLQQAIDCSSASEGIQFPLEFWDKSYGLVNDNFAL